MPNTPDDNLGKGMAEFVKGLQDATLPLKALVDSFGQLKVVVNELESVIKTFGAVTEKMSNLFNTVSKMAGAGGGGGAGGAAGGAGAMSAFASLAAAAPEIAVAVAVVAAVVAALAALTMAAVEAGKAIRENVGAQAMSGAMGLMGASQLHALAGSLGMSDSDLGKRARGFGDMIGGGGVAASMANSIGINPFNGLGGDQDFFSKFKKALEFITNPATNEKTAMQMSRYFGMEDQMYLRNASPEMRNMALNDVGMNMTAEGRRRAADEQIAFNMAMRDFMDLIKQAGTTILPALTNAFRHFGDILDGVIRAVISMIPGANMLYDASGLSGKVKGLNMPDKARAAQGDFSPHTGPEKTHQALNENTKALYHASDAVNRMNATFRDGVYGGGSAMHGNGVPNKWIYKDQGGLIREKAIAVGALSI